MSKKTVSIIIPFYGQTEAELAIPLGSINNQIGIDFSKVDVHLVNDGGKPVDPALFKVFTNLELQVHDLPENVGPGLARQYGIDHSEGQYVMFVDSDDLLYNAGSLLDFFNIVRAGQHQMILATIVSQLKQGYQTHRWNSYFAKNSAYGKWFNRSYLNKLQLRFQDLRVFEDSYFASLSVELSTDYLSIENVSYLQNYREDSTMNRGKHFILRQGHLFVRENRLKLEKIREVAPERLANYLELTLVGVYLFQKQYVPMRKDLFWEEMRLLAKEFPYDYETNFNKLQTIANLQSNAQGSQYYKVDVSGLREFVRKVIE